MFRRVHLLLAVALLATACQRPAAAPARSAEPAAGTRPAEAVRLLAARLRANDAVGFARIALPPALHARVAAGWREGRSRWPLDELPLDARLPALLATLSRPDAERQLLAAFDRQFAGAGRELRAAAHSLGLFGVEYVAQDASYSEHEREHYRQGIAALARWGGGAPLDDRVRARATLVQLAAAARRAGIAGEADLKRLGMEESLRRLGPVLGAFKAGFARYGLDLDASLDGLDASLLEQTGDDARVRVRYVLGGEPIDAVLALRRIDGRWYLQDHLRHAEASLAGAPAAAGEPASAGWWPFRRDARLARRAAPVR
jgi:hypothetical protein